ncbi:hypothetical protein [Xenorhabdus sp. KJ12.1]|uniref:hypothetical protein n=1 Tax=Xenorhabdus sp. KJ12.1 TaxID=1851571 RepID=UPI000C046C99|nr:hypothetical protein [Xenorhabdus sp. KJ12.1]PHM70390.1 hypothetical protein Xekj_02018 [Xenorhabdus sp. KJ12.1]
MNKLPRNYGWNRVKLAQHSYDDLERLEIDVKENHACEDGIYLIDAKGRKKLDAISWAIYYKNKAERNEKAGTEKM